MRRPLLVAVILVGGTIVGVGAFVTARAQQPVDDGTTTTTAPAVAAPIATAAPADRASPATTEPEATTSTTEPPRGSLTIQGVGDTNFDPSYIPSFVSEGYELAFSGLGGLFRGDDLTVVNLECTVSDLGSRLDKEFVFECDPDALPVARAFGVDVANLANNHSGDRGVEAMVDSRRVVAEAGILPVGVGRDLAEATAPAIVEVDGWTVAVLGMGGVVPSASWLATGDGPGMASGDDTAQMVAAVEAAAALADIVVVSIHWGWELEREPRADDRARAEAMVAAGADVIFGHHPHRLGELEFVDGAAVFWTLGNFVWPRLSDAGATSAIGRVVVSPDGSIDACLVPVFIERSGRPVVQASPTCSEHR